MARIHITVGGNLKVYFQNTSFLTSIFQLIGDFLEITRDNLTLTSVKVVPLPVTSRQKKMSAKTIAVSLRYSPKTADHLCQRSHARKDRMFMKT